MEKSLQLKSVKTDLLDVAYFEVGSDDDPVVMLLHGWPDDPVCWSEVAYGLSQQGWRVIAPYLRGFGPTRFWSDQTPRTGDLVALAQDAIAFADALSIDKFSAVGHDWGARAAYICACLYPKRIIHCAGLSVGWGTNNPTQALSLQQAQNYWYHWYMALDRGENLLRNDRDTFVEFIWNDWLVAKQADRQLLDRLSTTFANPDWVDVVLHSYRVRWGYADPDPAYLTVSDAVSADPTISVPTLCIHGGSDPCNDPSTSEGKEPFFTGKYTRVVLLGIGHFPQYEAPVETLEHLSNFLGCR